MINNQSSDSPISFFNNDILSSIDRPQYDSSCNVASLVACFRYLWPKDCSQIDQLKLAEILGFTIDDLNNGLNPGNRTIVEWANKCSSKLNVTFKHEILFEKGWDFDSDENSTNWNKVKQTLLTHFAQIYFQHVKRCNIFR